MASTIMALLKALPIISILDDITSNLVNNASVIVISADLSKAFDTVNQAHIMEKLANYSIIDKVYNWMIN